MIPLLQIWTRTDSELLDDIPMSKAKLGKEMLFFFGEGLSMPEFRSDSPECRF